MVFPLKIIIRKRNTEPLNLFLKYKIQQKHCIYAHVFYSFE